MLSLEEINKDLKERLSSGRYAHSVRVALEAKKLAIHYGVDEYDAYLAGLLHDVAKEFSMDENKRWITKYNLSFEWLNESNIKVCHAEIGSFVARELYGVSECICQAIRYHSLGNKEMNMLDKIIFVADKIEEGKNYPGIEEERVLAYKNIDEALILVLKNNKKKLESMGSIFNKELYELLDYLTSLNIN